MEVAAAQGRSFLHGCTKTSDVPYSYQSINVLSLRRSHLPHRQIWSRISLRAKQKPRLNTVSASASPETPTDTSTDVWVLDPIGDGDWRHIGVRVERPGSYQIVSSSVTVGRISDKADLVIPVATVSGVHARFEKRKGSLYLADLGSTNGTYVNETRLNPGEMFPVVPGNRITFGDSNLAIFMISKKEKVEVSREAEQPKGEGTAGKESSPDAQQTSV